ncbi:MAG: hypothetical protein ABR910_10180 [Acidobacteriaceae bacterium]
MAGKTPREATGNFIYFIRETLNCVTQQEILAYQESDHLHKLLFKSPAAVTAKNGGRFYLQINQTFTIIPTDDGLFKAHSREYSYIFSNDETPGGIVSYHWHPHSSSVHDPHLHIHISQNVGYPEIERRISRAHFPTSRVCIEDFILLLIKYYDIQPILAGGRWRHVLRKNKKAFAQQATWFVTHAE